MNIYGIGHENNSGFLLQCTWYPAVLKKVTSWNLTKYTAHNHPSLHYTHSYSVRVIGIINSLE